MAPVIDRHDFWSSGAAQSQYIPISWHLSLGSVHIGSTPAGRDIVCLGNQSCGQYRFLYYCWGVDL